MRRLLIVCLLLLLPLLAAAPALAAPRVLRDAETENFLQRLSAPVLRAAGLDPSAVTFVVLDSPDLNAFVAGGQNIFLYSGLILKVESPQQLLGVIAHETGHIAGGHLVRSDRAMRNASAEAILTTVATVIAGLAAGSPDLAAAGAAMGQNVGARGFFAFSRTQEGSADAAALSYLADTGTSAQGLLEFMQIMQGEELLPAGRQDPYIRTHPLTRDRIDALRSAVANERGRKPLPPALIESFARIQAKLLGYQKPAQALTRYKADSPSAAERIGRGWALYRQSRMAEAVAVADAELKRSPDDPWVLELKGQALLESGQAAAAVPSYRRAVALVPDSGLLQLGLAQALLNSGTPADVAPAIRALESADRLEPNQPGVAELLSQAYGRQGDEIRARLYAAQLALLKRDKKLARHQAEWVVARAPAGSRPALKAQDMLDQLRDED